MDSTRKIMENRFRLHKSTKSQNVNRSQKSTLLTGLRLGVGKLRRDANSGVKNSVLLLSSPEAKHYLKTRFLRNLTQNHFSLNSKALI
jgi:hypothetical protein